MMEFVNMSVSESFWVSWWKLLIMWWIDVGVSNCVEAVRFVIGD
jgi:hypothetical protein